MSPRHNPFGIDDRPALSRLTFFAAALGTTPDTVERMAADGRLRLEIMRLGPAQIRYVRTVDADRILTRLKEPTHASD